MKDLRQFLAHGFRTRPTGQGFCGGVHEGHATPRIGSDDAIANAGERDFEPLALFALRLLGASACRMRETNEHRHEGEGSERDDLVPGVDNPRVR